MLRSMGCRCSKPPLVPCSMRSRCGSGIASCAACHGPLGFTPGAPELRGQQRAYLEQEMQAFKVGKRHNDISEQMRSVARPLTNDEIAKLAAYYSSFATSTGR